MSEKWPRLSQTLPGEKHPRQCQSCNRHDHEIDECDLETWCECDDHDQPERVYVVLCETCNKTRDEHGKPSRRRTRTLIDVHPRLYSQVPKNAWLPGITHLCDDCTHRTGHDCSMARFNGGEGLTLNGPKPRTYHINARPRIGFVIIYERVRTCSARETP